MKKFLLVCAALLIGCSNCSTPKPDPSPPAVSTPMGIPDAGPPQPTATATATASVPQPVQELIDWKTPEELLDIGRRNPNVCAMAFFPDVLNDTTIMEERLRDPKLAKIINKMFVSMKFPVTKENLPLVVKEFGLEGLPALMFTPPSDTMVLQVHGNPPVDKLIEALEQVSQKDAPFEKCASIKAKLD